MAEDNRKLGHKLAEPVVITLQEHYCGVKR